MSFRALTDAEKAVLLKRIESVEKDIEERQHYLARLKLESGEGVWVSDGHFPELPEPNCYICCYRVHLLGRCSKGDGYGKVCGDYQHFTGVFSEVKR